MSVDYSCFTSKHGNKARELHDLSKFCGETWIDFEAKLL